MDSFAGYERFYLEIESGVRRALLQHHPRSWDENAITHSVLHSFRQLGPQINISRGQRDDINIQWDFLKLTGHAEQVLGDIAFLVRIKQKDGKYLDGIGAIEAKKIGFSTDEYLELLGSRKPQLQKQVLRLPYSLVVLYDHQEISGYQANLPHLDDPHFFWHRPSSLLETTHALCVPGNIVLAADRRDRTLYPLGVPLAFQIAWRFLRGFDLHYDQDNLSLMRSAVGAVGGISLYRGGFRHQGDLQPDLPFQVDDMEGYERLPNATENDQ